jgi:type I restriction enzyme S subunit
MSVVDSLTDQGPLGTQVAFKDAVLDASAGSVRVPSNSTTATGKFPVIDQGQLAVSGYVDSEESLCSAELPVVLFGDHTRVVKFVDFPFCIGADGVKVLRPRDTSKLDPKFLYHSLRNLRIPAGGYDRHFKYLKRTVLSLPPLAEQRRVVDILDRADDLRAKRQAAIDKLGSLTQAIFHEMFGGSLAQGDPWERLSLGDLTKATRPICYGVLKPGPHVDGGVPLIKIQDLVGGQVSESAIQLIDPGLDHEFRRSSLRGGEVLLSIQGTIGRLAICPERLAGANISRTIALIAPDERVESRFLMEYLRAVGLRTGFESSGSTRASLNISAIRKMQISIPPLRLQQQFCKLVTRIDSVEGLMRCGTEEIISLGHSLRQQGFRGAP